MKKVLLTLALAAFAMAANAQFVLGGNIGINHSNSHSDDYVSGTAETNISILPKIGYWLNDDMQIGAQLGWVYGYERSYASADDTYTSTPQSVIVFAPYFRYNFAEWKKLKVFCEAQLGIGFGLESHTHWFVNGDEIDGSPSDNGNNFTSFGLNVVPGLNYSFNDHISMDIYVNLLGLYANVRSNDDGSGTHSWGLMANMGAQDLNAHLSNFSIGFNYAL